MTPTVIVLLELVYFIVAHINIISCQPNCIIDLIPEVKRLGMSEIVKRQKTGKLEARICDRSTAGIRSPYSNHGGSGSSPWLTRSPHGCQLRNFSVIRYSCIFAFPFCRFASLQLAESQENLLSYYVASRILPQSR